MFKLFYLLEKIEVFFLTRKYNKLLKYAYNCDFHKRINNFEKSFPSVEKFHASYLPRMIRKLEEKLNSLGY